MNNNCIRGIKEAALRLRRLLCVPGQIRTSKDKQTGYLIITWCSPAVKKAAQESGMYQFHSSNTTNETYYEHQLVLYSRVGYKAFINGFECVKGEMGCHHLNSIRDDNRPENLEYASVADNNLAAAACATKDPYCYGHKEGTKWNNQGECIVNSKHHLAGLISRTLQATRGIQVSQVQALLQLPYMVYKEVCRYSRWIWEAAISCPIKDDCVKRDNDLIWSLDRI